MPQAPRSRYTYGAIILHWLMAFALAGMVVSGLWMTGAIDRADDRALAFRVYQLHKSFGLSLLVLLAVRLAWRLTHRPPALPSTMAKAMRGIAHITHWGLYVLMAAVPLAGWAMVSASVWDLPTIWFGLFEWPHLPGLADLPVDRKGPVEETLKDVHRLLAYGLAGIVLIHAGAALKHHVIDGDDILSRMIPMLKPKRKPDPDPHPEPGA